MSPIPRKCCCFRHIIGADEFSTPLLWQVTVSSVSHHYNEIIYVKNLPQTGCKWITLSSLTVINAEILELLFTLSSTLKDLSSHSVSLFMLCSFHVGGVSSEVKSLHSKARLVIYRKCRTSWLECNLCLALLSWHVTWNLSILIKSKIHVFPPTCSAIHRSILFWCDLAKLTNVTAWLRRTPLMFTTNIVTSTSLLFMSRCRLPSAQWFSFRM